MRPLSRTFVHSICIVVVAACGDDGPSPSVSRNSSTDQYSDAAAPRQSDAATQTRKGPWGCYIETEHQCDCDIKSEPNCQDVGLWTEGCTSCATQPETHDAGDPATGAGCYDPGSHQCDCQIAEAACEQAAAVWTDSCLCRIPTRDAAAHTEAGAPFDASAELDASAGLGKAPPALPDATPNGDGAPKLAMDAAKPVNPTPDAATEVYGCYLSANHECDCSLPKALCTDGGVWTAGCNSCNP